MSRIVCINGTINSGKSTAGRRLAQLLPNAWFLDDDDHGAEPTAELSVRVAAAMERIEREILSFGRDYLVIAYPLRSVDHARIAAACRRRAAKLFIVTLSPPIGVALANRGDRLLSEHERSRIVEMYREGFASRPFSDLCLDNSAMTADDTAQVILSHLTGASRPGDTAR